MILIALAAVSAVCALVYGAALVHRPPSWARTVVKTAAVALLAAIAVASNQAWTLAAALALSAAGDAFLAGDPDRWLPAGLAAFLVAHLFYVALFLTIGGGWPHGAALTVALIVLAAAASLFVWLAPRLGKLGPAVALYVLALGAMAATSLALPPLLRLAAVGALAFMASDALLSAELFRGFRLAGSARLTAAAVWVLYYAGQALILAAFLVTTSLPMAWREASLAMASPARSSGKVSETCGLISPAA